MNTFFKKNTATILVVGATVVLAAIALFTAVRLYQLRQTAVSPNEPESEPAASEQVTPTNPPSQCNLQFSLTVASASPTVRASASPTVQASASPTSTATPTATPTEPPIGGQPTPTPTQTSSPTPKTTSSPSPTPATLPDAGVGLPTMLGIAAGFFFLIGAVLLAI